MRPITYFTNEINQENTQKQIFLETELMKQKKISKNSFKKLWKRKDIRIAFFIIGLIGIATLGPSEATARELTKRAGRAGRAALSSVEAAKIEQAAAAIQSGIQQNNLPSIEGYSFANKSKEKFVDFALSFVFKALTEHNPTKNQEGLLRLAHELDLEKLAYKKEIAAFLFNKAMILTCGSMAFQKILTMNGGAFPVTTFAIKKVLEIRQWIAKSLEVKQNKKQQSQQAEIEFDNVWQSLGGETSPTNTILTEKTFLYHLNHILAVYPFSRVVLLTVILVFKQKNSKAFTKFQNSILDILRIKKEEETFYIKLKNFLKKNFHSIVTTQAGILLLFFIITYRKELYKLIVNKSDRNKAIDVLKSNISVIRELSQSNISNLKHWTNEFYKNMKTYVIRDKNNILKNDQTIQVLQEKIAELQQKLSEAAILNQENAIQLDRCCDAVTILNDSYKDLDGMHNELYADLVGIKKHIRKSTSNYELVPLGTIEKILKTNYLLIDPRPFLARLEPLIFPKCTPTETTDETSTKVPWWEWDI